MILLKTKTFVDIWEKNGIAPFNSSYIGEQILKYSEKCPLEAIGFYSERQKDKKISLLKIYRIEKTYEKLNDIKVHFEFVKKINIRSEDFEKKLSSHIYGLVSIIDSKIIYNVINGKNKDKKNRKEYNINFLNDFFYSQFNWKEFENICAILLNILGFEVKLKGHTKEKERVADIYCYSPPFVKENRICLIIDCKNIEKYFINASDERAMKEYILDKKMISSQEGIKQENIFFLFINISYSDKSLQKLQEISKETKTFGAVITLQNLIYLVEKKLKMGYKFYLEYFPKLFKNQEITHSQIDFVYKKDEEFTIFDINY